MNKIFLEEMLQTLKPKERQLIYMRYFRDMTQTEVAGELGVSQVQVSRMEKKDIGRPEKTGIKIRSAQISQMVSAALLVCLENPFL